MSFGTEEKSSKGVDKQLEAFLERERKSQQFQQFGQTITDICWETCIHTLTYSLDSSTRNCLVNCTERFLDTSNFIAYRLAHIALSSPKEEDLK